MSVVRDVRHDLAMAQDEAAAAAAAVREERAQLYEEPARLLLDLAILGDEIPRAGILTAQERALAVVYEEEARCLRGRPPDEHADVEITRRRVASPGSRP
jgi:hypothetical protein